MISPGCGRRKSEAKLTPLAILLFRVSFCHSVCVGFCNLVVVVVAVQAATLVQRHTATALEHEARLAEAAADAGAATVGGGILTAGNTGRPALYVLRARRAFIFERRRTTKKINKTQNTDIASE